jgi:hypothetical protein
VAAARRKCNLVPLPRDNRLIPTVVTFSPIWPGATPRSSRISLGIRWTWRRFGGRGVRCRRERCWTSGHAHGGCEY